MRRRARSGSWSPGRRGARGSARTSRRSRRTSSGSTREAAGRLAGPGVQQRADQAVGGLVELVPLVEPGRAHGLARCTASSRARWWWTGTASSGGATWPSSSSRRANGSSANAASRCQPSASASTRTTRSYGGASGASDAAGSPGVSGRAGQPGDRLGDPVEAVGAGERAGEGAAPPRRLDRLDGRGIDHRGTIGACSMRRSWRATRSRWPAT